MIDVGKQFMKKNDESANDDTCAVPQNTDDTINKAVESTNIGLRPKISENFASSGSVVSKTHVLAACKEISRT